MKRVFETKNNCCGCGACVFQCPVDAIRMTPDSKGFIYPEIDQEKCIDCGRCRKSCAFHNRNNDGTDQASVIATYALKHKDPDVLKNSTSGGAFTAFSDLVLERGGVVFGAVMNEQLKVVHTCARTREERNAMRGSKYVQSDLNSTFPQIKDLLKQGTEVMFVGMPCQVDALKSYLSKEDTSKLLLCDLVCKGVPNQKLFCDYCAYVEKKTGEKLIGYIFRDKRNDKDSSWGSSACNLYANGREDNISFLAQIHRYVFGTAIALRPSCYHCKYTNLHRTGDLTIGDFWGIKHISPEMYDQRGVSLVMLSTQKAQMFFDQVKSSSNYQEVTVQDAVSGQPRLRQPVEEPPVRQMFWTEYHNNGYEAAIKRHLNCGFKGQFAHWTRRVGIYPVLLKIKTMLHI